MTSRVPPVYSPVSVRGLMRAVSPRFDGERERETAASLVATRFTATEAVLTDTGTSALVAAIRLLVPISGTIALPAYGCVDLTAAAVRADVKVRLYDIDPWTLSPDIESVRRAAKRGLDAIIVTHLYGYAADFTAVSDVAAEFGIPVIEDAAQAGGGTLHGIALGACGDVSIVSFGRGKGLAAGSGGAILLRGPDAPKRAEMAAATLGPSKSGGFEIVALAAQWLFARRNMYALPSSIPALRLGETVYKPARDPRRISRVAGALLPTALQLEAAELACRKDHATKILSAIARGRRVDPIKAIRGGESGYLRFPVLDRTGEVAPDLRIGAVRGYPMTLDQHPELRALLHSAESAERGCCQLRDRLFTLPTHSRVRAADIIRMARWAGDQRLASPAHAWAT